MSIEQTNPLDSGYTTSEAQGSKAVVIISSIIALLGTLAKVLESTTALVPDSSKGIGLWLAIAGVSVAGLTQIAYTVSRTLVKINAIQSSAVVASPSASCPAPTPKGFINVWGLATLVAFAAIFATLFLLFSPLITRADDAAPAAASKTLVLPSLKINDTWTAELNVNVGPLIGYRIPNLSKAFSKNDHGSWATDIDFGAQIAFQHVDWPIAFLVGGTANVTKKAQLTGDVMIAGPKWTGLTTGGYTRLAGGAAITRAGGPFSGTFGFTFTAGF